MDVDAVTNLTYFIDTYMHHESETLRWYFNHDHDQASECKCPIFGKYGEVDCLELTIGQLDILKDKLIMKDIKLMYVLK